MLAYLDGGTWVEWSGQRRPGPGGGQYTLPPNAGDVMSETELADYGLHHVAEAWPIPDGHRAISTTISDDGGAPRWMVGSEPVPFSDLLAARLAALADRRWQAETGGMVVEGVPVATDDRSQGKITGAALDASLDPSATVHWKCADGVFRTLDADQILALGRAMRAHVQACFDREAVLMAALQSVTSAAALAAVDIDAGWPA
jgi:hypothetical protein